MKRIRINGAVMGVGNSSIFPLPSSFEDFFLLTSSFLHHNDCEELVKILVVRCKKINEDIENNKIKSK